MNDTLQKCLEDLENRIDAGEEKALLEEWREFSEGRFSGRIFSPRRTGRRPPAVEWPVVGVNEALESPEAMALQQYRGCSRCLAEGSGAPLSVRANFGSSIIPLLFGVEPFVMPPETDTLPTSMPLHDTDAVREVVEKGPPSLEGGYGARVFEMGRFFRRIAEEYPKIGAHVHIYHPDLQGPLDICEVVWGSEVFYAFYDTPDLVKALLDLITDTYAAFMHKWAEIAPLADGFNVHWDMAHRGRIMLRNDSAMNVSPEQFDEFSRPYDRRLLDEFGGGAVHFCGRGDHYISRLAEIPGLYAVNPSQPQYNDMEHIFASTIDKGLNIIDLKVEAARAAAESGRELHGRVHCADLVG